MKVLDARHSVERILAHVFYAIGSHVDEGGLYGLSTALGRRVSVLVRPRGDARSSVGRLPYRDHAHDGLIGVNRRECIDNSVERLLIFRSHILFHGLSFLCHRS